METAPQFAALVMADISGYTRFTRMHYTSLLHAEEIISELVEAVIGAAEFPLRIAQLEGDAVLMLADAPTGREAAACRDVTNQLQGLFASFSARERALISCDAGCACDACNQIGSLKLKAAIHFGEYTSRRVGSLEELGGSDVNLLRSLIKAPIQAREYVLMTERFHRLGGGLPGHTAPDLNLELESGPTLVYYPRLAVNQVLPEPGSGPGLSLRLNQHAFARMFHRKPRARYENLSEGGMNVLLYLLEGMLSPLNILGIALGRRLARPAIEIRPTVLMLAQVESPEPELARHCLAALVSAAQYPLVLNKLEGNVAMFYAVAAEAADTALDVMRQTENLFAAFNRKAAQTPEAGLRCKILLHCGDVAFKAIRHFDEIAGEDVILIHRLLKNAGGLPTDLVLMTAPFYESAGLSDGQAEMRIEKVDDFGEMPLWVCLLA